MIPVIDDKKFMRDMQNIIGYTEGFLDGVQRGKPKLLKNVAENLKTMVGEYIDASARVNPAQLHHVYEWYATGSPEARLFTIHYNIRGDGLTMRAQVQQSKIAKQGSDTPFRNKAFIMENGISVTISPRKSPVLVFEEDGETIFTRKSVTVQNPGGPATINGLEINFRQFFTSYLSQSVLLSSGLGAHLKNPIEFKQNLRAGKSGGRPVGVSVGMRWIGKETQ